MISSRPYLIRALFEWLVDCDLTPHLLVDVSGDQVVIRQMMSSRRRVAGPA